MLQRYAERVHGCDGVLVLSAQDPALGLERLAKQYFRLSIATFVDQDQA
jgi:hypothetical protein